MNEVKWEYTKGNAIKVYDLWFSTKRELLGIGAGLTEANEQANIKVYKLTGTRMKAWLDMLDRE